MDAVKIEGGFRCGPACSGRQGRGLSQQAQRGAVPGPATCPAPLGPASQPPMPALPCSNRVKAVQAVVEAGVAVMGHVGLTPQSISVLGGFRPAAQSGAHGRGRGWGAAPAQLLARGMPRHAACLRTLRLSTFPHHPCLSTSRSLRGVAGDQGGKGARGGGLLLSRARVRARRGGGRRHLRAVHPNHRHRRRRWHQRAGAWGAVRAFGGVCVRCHRPPAVPHAVRAVPHAVRAAQVLVYHDLLGMMQHPHHAKVTPKFCKQYSAVGRVIQQVRGCRGVFGRCV